MKWRKHNNASVSIARNIWIITKTPVTDLKTFQSLNLINFTLLFLSSTFKAYFSQFGDFTENII